MFPDFRHKLATDGLLLGWRIVASDSNRWCRYFYLLLVASNRENFLGRIFSRSVSFFSCSWSIAKLIACCSVVARFGDDTCCASSASAIATYSPLPFLRTAIRQGALPSVVTLPLMALQTHWIGLLRTAVFRRYLWVLTWKSKWLKCKNSHIAFPISHKRQTGQTNAIIISRCNFIYNNLPTTHTSPQYLPDCSTLCSNPV